MVATVAPAGMPTRQYSSMIVAGSWPLTDPQNFHSAAEAQHAKGAQLINCAEELHQLASGVAADQSGHFIDGFCGWCTSTAGEYVDTADQFFAMARVSEEVGRLLYGLREDLDEIDRRAHEEIQRIQQSMGVGRALQAGAQIMAIVAKARAEAQAKAAEVAGKIAQLGTQIGINPASGPGTAGGPASQTPSGTDPVNPRARELGNGEGRRHPARSACRRRRVRSSSGAAEPAPRRLRTHSPKLGDQTGRATGPARPTRRAGGNSTWWPTDAG